MPVEARLDRPARIGVPPEPQVHILALVPLFQTRHCRNDFVELHRGIMMSGVAVDNSGDVYLIPYKRLWLGRQTNHSEKHQLPSFHSPICRKLSKMLDSASWLLASSPIS